MVDGANPQGMRLSAGQNHFWLTYTLSEDESYVGRMIDAKLISCIVNRYNATDYSTYTMELVDMMTETDPPSAKTIVAPPVTHSYYYVGGAAGTGTYVPGYSTFADLAYALSGSGFLADIEVRVIGNITETMPVNFTGNPVSDDYEIYIRPYLGSYTITSAIDDPDLGVLNFIGHNKIRIEGNYQGNPGGLTLAKTVNCSAVRVVNCADFSISNCNLSGVVDVITLSNANNPIITGNTLRNANNFAVKIENSTNAKIGENIIDGMNSTIFNGVLLNNTNNSEVYRNYINTLSATNNNARAFLIQNNATGVHIHNNTIGNINAPGGYTASAFEIDANNISVNYNTVIIDNSQASNVSVINVTTTNVSNISWIGNLFINKVPTSPGTNSHFISLPVSVTSGMFNPEQVENNLYNGISSFAITDGNLVNLANWRQSGADQNSN